MLESFVDFRQEDQGRGRALARIVPQSQIGNEAKTRVHGAAAHAWTCSVTRSIFASR